MLESRPSRTEAWASLLAGGLALVVAAAASWPSTLLAGAGFALLGWGIWRGDSRGITGGAVGLFAGVALAGTTLSVLPTLLGGIGALLAWDAGHHARGLGRQLGRGATTRSVELGHVGASLAVGVGTAGVAYVGYLLVVGQLGGTGVAAGAAAVGVLLVYLAFGSGR
ncbi:DUF7519 family protein [Haloarchaeobius amylolyticus]|uniref:DUF7519 family protein n=1 Tax=Haloarchaeobius amylolyticus TaxID=1198296 RepID=UPI002270BCCB|nr:hypothetical protein [Haloarchaeobius amylolyticus]